jgi:3-oxoadipate enol-lactonase
MPVLDPDVTVIREGNGKPLMLLHCLGVDHRFWDLARPLGADFTLYRYDLPGHGSSVVPNGAYTIADLSDQLAALMEKHGVARAHVAGISLGGLIAQHFAASHPGRVSRLILIDTTPRYTEEMRAMWAERAATARTKGVAVMVDALLKIWFSGSALANETDGVRYVRAALTRCSGEGYALACEALAQADLRELAPRIRAPALVICGDDDIPSFLDAAHWLAGNIRAAELAWIAGARHASVLEKPDAAVRLMRDFLRSSAR